MEYATLNNGLKIKYHATTDKDTIINITNHSYFNFCNIISIDKKQTLKSLLFQLNLLIFY